MNQLTATQIRQKLAYPCGKNSEGAALTGTAESPGAFTDSAALGKVVLTGTAVLTGKTDSSDPDAALADKMAAGLGHLRYFLLEVDTQVASGVAALTGELLVLDASEELTGIASGVAAFTGKVLVIGVAALSGPVLTSSASCVADMKLELLWASSSSGTNSMVSVFPQSSALPGAPMMAWSGTSPVLTAAGALTVVASAGVALTEFAPAGGTVVASAAGALTVVASAGGALTVVVSAGGTGLASAGGAPTVVASAGDALTVVAPLITDDAAAASGIGGGSGLSGERAEPVITGGGCGLTVVAADDAAGGRGTLLFTTGAGPGIFSTNGGKGLGTPGGGAL